MIGATLLNRPFSTSSEIGYTVINAAIWTGAGAVCGRVLNANVGTCAVIGGLYSLLTYVPSRIMAHSKQLSISAKLFIGGIYESCIVSASILALRHFGVIGKHGTIFLASFGAFILLHALLRASTVHSIEKHNPNPSPTALSYIV